MTALLAERIAACDRLEAGQEAEGQGLRAASRFEVCRFPYSTDPYLQARFEQGFKEGQVILQIQKEVPHASLEPISAAAVADGGLRVGESDDSDVRTAPEAEPPSSGSGYQDW